MATRTRETALASGKEKRGTSPSNVPHRATKPSSPARKNPTSTNDASKLQPKKPLSTNVTKTTPSPSCTQKSRVSPSPALRTSGKSATPLDNTTSASRTQKSRVSPSPTLRSSGKPVVTSQKPVHDKNVKPAKGTLYARPVASVKKTTTRKQTAEKTSTSSTKNEQSISSPHEEDGAPATPDHAPEHETHVEEHESPIALQDDEKNILEDEAPIDNEINEAESESPSVLEPEDVSLEESEDIQPTEEQELEIIPDEIESNITNENVTDNDTNEEVKEEDEIIMDNKEDHVTIESKTADSTETEVQVNEIEKIETEPETPKQVILTGKHGSPVSNDAIEETASKLREQRKNRVKALAGAFESVMQDTGNNNS